MKNMFDEDDVDDIIDRITELTSTSTPQWGKMNVAQMLAHCSVAYEMAYNATAHTSP